MKKFKFLLKRWIFSLCFSKYERVHIWQSMYGRINKLHQLKSEKTYWDTYYYEDDIKELGKLQDIVKVIGRDFNDFEP